jgi:hypothetical protein
VNLKNFACWFETGVPGHPELALRLPPERVRELRESRPGTFGSPTARTWSHWLGIVMTPDAVDWAELSQLLLDAYVHTAPVRLRRVLEAQDLPTAI